MELFCYGIEVLASFVESVLILSTVIVASSPIFSAKKPFALQLSALFCQHCTLCL